MYRNSYFRKITALIILMIFSFSTMIQPVEAISQKDNIKDIVSLATEPENTIEGETEEDIELEESIDNEEQNNEKIAEEVMGKGEGDLEENIESEESTANEEESSEGVKEEDTVIEGNNPEDNIESEQENTTKEEQINEIVTEEDIITNDNIIDGNMETDRYIIRLKSGKEEATKEKIKNKLKKEIKEIKQMKNKSFGVIRLKNKTKHKDFKEKLNKFSIEVEYIQPDYKINIYSQDQYLDEQWGLYNVFSNQSEELTSPIENAKKIWDIGNGEGTVVAVIDTSIDINHEDLMENIWVNAKEIEDDGIDNDGNGYVDDINGWNFYDDTSLIYEKGINEEHGTHIAGIIAAEKDNKKGIAGVAPKAEIMTLKAFGQGKAYTSDIIEAIEYAQEMGAQIVNCSWGGEKENLALKEIIEQSNMLFICAAGNSSNDVNIEPIYPAAFDLDNIITVASINKNNKLSTFSNYGQALVDVTAPGEEIISTIPENEYQKLSGTSMATAFVSGEAALLRSIDSSLNSKKIKERIISSSDKYSNLTNKIKSGNKINIYNGAYDKTGDNNDNNTGGEIIIDPSDFNTEKTIIIKNYYDNPTVTKEDNGEYKLSSIISEIDYDKYLSIPSVISEISNETISPNTGSLKYEYSILNLPGRNGLDLDLKVIYDSSKAGFYRTTFLGIDTGDKYVYNNKRIVDTYVEERFNLGVGWFLNLPSIETEEIDYDNDKVLINKYLHLENGGSYKINISDNESSNLKEYPLRDIRIDEDNGSYSNGTLNSAYVLAYKNGKKEYFSENGELIGRIDRCGNEIKFKYQEINGRNLLTEITDTIGRKVLFSYSSSANGDKIVTITMPDGTTVKLVLQEIQESEVPENENLINNNTEYVLKEIIDQEERKAFFEYDYEDDEFDLVCTLNYEGDPDWYNEFNYYANLNKITYPTYNTFSTYDYESFMAYKAHGYFHPNRIVHREDMILDGTTENIYNSKDFSYSGNYTRVEDSDDTYSTSMEDESSTCIEYEFNYKHLLQKSEAKYTGGTSDKILKEISRTYDTRKMPDKETTTIYGYNGSSFTTGTGRTTTENWDYDIYGDLKKYVNEEGQINTYEYDTKYHQLTREKHQIDSTRYKETTYVIDSTTGNLKEVNEHHMENGVSKPIRTKYSNYDSFGNPRKKQIIKRNGTVIEENYEYSSIYKSAYLTRKTINVKDYTGSSKTIEEKYEYYYNTGLLKKHIDGNLHSISYEYDNIGRMIREINHDGSNKNIYFDDTNNIITLKLENGHKIRNDYDGLGKLIKKEELKEGTTNTWIKLQENYYNQLSQLQWTKDAYSNKTSYEYDLFGRIRKVINPDSSYKESKFYDVSNKKIEYDEERKKHTYYYDNLGKITREQVTCDGKTYNTYYNYDYLGNLENKLDGRSYSTYYEYDDLGRLIEVKNASNEKTTYEYNNLNEITKTINQEYDTNNNLTREITTEKEYDELGRLIKTIGSYENRADTSSNYIAYDKAGNIDHTKDREGQKTSYTYDSRNRIKTQTVKNRSGNIESTETYNYDMLYSQNKITVTDSNGTITYEYYKNGNVKKETVPSSTKYTYYWYYNDGKPYKIKDPYGLITQYTYDNRRRIDKITVDGKIFDYSYYDNGMIQKLKYPVNSGTLQTEYTFNTANQLQTLKNTVGSTIENYSYAYDGNRNITRITENNQATSYNYDKLNRLSYIQRPNTNETNLTYDGRGNRKSIVTTDTNIINILSEVQTNDYTYNSLNQLTAFNEDNNTYTYKYNHKGLRIEKLGPSQGTKYYYNQGGQVIAESDGNGSLKAQIIWGYKPLARKANGKYYFYIYNGHGDVVKLADENGNIKNSYKYDEWGNILEETETIENPIKYAGEYNDKESGLIYLRARYYDPVTGRFISKDSYEGTLANPLSQNLYIYCYNNPLGYIDPSGHIPSFNELAEQLYLSTQEDIQISSKDSFIKLLQDIKAFSNRLNEKYKDNRIDASDISLGEVTLKGFGVGYETGTWKSAFDELLIFKRTSSTQVTINNDILGKPRVGSALKLDKYHAFNDIVDNYAGAATKTSLNNGAMLYQIEGSLNGVSGRFEWITQYENVTHRMFVPGGTMNGVPIKP